MRNLGTTFANLSRQMPIADNIEPELDCGLTDDGENKMVTTRTIGPIHTEDLEPHRFEDLIRQLLYDFRNWRSLEATGRSGADSGFDIQGTEVGESSAIDETGDDDEIDTYRGDRVWLIQCKREKAISPKKLTAYLEALASVQGLHGIIFAAACDFSMAARNAFRQTVSQLGVREALLWGKGEIEDLLFQPKNDHLLFAYFGVSLQLRRRTIKTETRAILATKRKAESRLTKNRPAVIRDATETRYPYLDQDAGKPRHERGSWTVLTYLGCFSDGLHFLQNRYLAYVDNDRNEWDYTKDLDTGPVDGGDNPWRRDREGGQTDLRRSLMGIWDGFKPQQKAWYEVYLVLPYRNIIDIDETGDEWSQHPHIYTSEFAPKKGPFTGLFDSLITADRFFSVGVDPIEENRVSVFPPLSKPTTKG